MPLFIVLMLIIGSVYQLFFRFEHWVDPQQSKIVYERDNLTGQTHIIRPGEQVSLLSRLVGSFGETTISKNNGPFALSLIEDEEKKSTKQNKKSKQPTRVVFRENKIPEPKEIQSTRGNQDNRSDLNHDGITEQVLINKSARDGLLDISVLEGQREVFYGRGQRINILPTSTAGWSDIALDVTNQEKLTFRYNPAISGYEVQP